MSPHKAPMDHAIVAPLSKDEFVTDEQLKYFRKITYLLNLTEPIQSSLMERGSRFVYRDRSDRGKHAKRYLDLEMLYNILNRKSGEALALLPGERKVNETNIYIFVARNPQHEEHVHNKALQGIPKVDCVFSPLLSTDIATSDQALVSAVRQWFKNGSRTVELTLAEHCQLVAYLLRQCHQKDQNRAASRAAHNRLLSYVLLSSHKAIYEDRMRPGWSRHNYWYHLVEKLDGHLGDEKLMDSEDSASLSPALPSFQQKEILAKAIQAEVLNSDCLQQPVFDARGRRSILKVIRWLLQRNRDALEAIPPLAKQANRECSRQIHARQQLFKKKINKEDSQDQVEKDVENILLDCMTIFANGEDLTTALEQVMSAQKDLDWFCIEFEESIKKACAWLARSQNEHRTTKESKFQGFDPTKAKYDSSSSTKGPNTSAGPTSQSGRSSSPAKPPQSSPPNQLTDMQVETAGDLSNVPSSQAYDEADKSEDAMDVDFADDSVADERLEMEDLVEGDIHAWGASLHKWLQLIVLHCSSAMSLQTGILDKAAQYYLRTLVTKNVEAVPEFRDTECEDQESVLSKLYSYGTEEENQENINIVRTWIKKQQRDYKDEEDQAGKEPPSSGVELLKSTKFTGTMHCESILLTLHELGKRLQASCKTDDQINEALSENAGRFKIEPQILRSLAAIDNVLAVSKKCCPACHLVVLRVEGQRIDVGKTLLYAGYHVVWFPVIMPPWTFKDAADGSIVEATRALRSRLELIINNEKSLKETNARKRSPDCDTPLAGDPASSPKKRWGEDRSIIYFEVATRR